MEIANASHYDGATALAEAAIMALNVVRNRRKIVVARSVNPQYRAVLRTYLQGLDVEIVGDETPGSGIAEALAQVDDQTALLIVQNPDFLGRLHNLRGLGAQVQARGHCWPCISIRLPLACSRPQPKQAPTSRPVRDSRLDWGCHLAARTSVSSPHAKNMFIKLPVVLSV